MGYGNVEIEDCGIRISDLVISIGVRRYSMQDKDKFLDNSGYRLLAEENCASDCSKTAEKY
jgi:uncharacterized membrane protein YqiK